MASVLNIRITAFESRTAIEVTVYDSARIQVTFMIQSRSLRVDSRERPVIVLTRPKKPLYLRIVRVIWTYDDISAWYIV